MATAQAVNNGPAIRKSHSDNEVEEDILTRIQTHLDQLATQFYASVRYLSTHHPLLDFDGTPLNSITSLPLSQTTAPPIQAPGTTLGSSTLATEPDFSQEKKSKKDKRDKAAKDDADGPEPAAKPPLSPDWTPLEPDSFGLDIAELADDLITKQKQIEDLLAELPQELEQEEQKQEQRIRELVSELEDLESEVVEVRARRDTLLDKIEGVIEAVGRRGGGR
ncbi:MAG: hypothetical protein GOMPHAMPRED_005209 [Gomphillus americanus]|uniref:Mediator of RNA polymerase II transcription subunit 21 n=1 Tax=Gomphillus americanus TaxID=1940652 RepID=A0A8H3FP99_9LECA|nr:MAG: hypothetical protein GOMPHAMPRED_005209 [Gomphillus americanus]